MVPKGGSMPVPTTVESSSPLTTGVTAPGPQTNPRNTARRTLDHEQRSIEINGHSLGTAEAHRHRNRLLELHAVGDDAATPSR